MSIQRSVIVSPKRFEGPFDQDGSGGIVRVSLGYKDFIAATTTTDYVLPPFPGGVIVEDVFGVVRTLFSGGAAATATLSIGSGATIGAIDYDDLGLAENVFTGATPTNGLIWGATALKGDRLISTTNSPVFVNGTNPYSLGYIGVELITTVGNTNVLTAGKVDIFLKLRAASVRP